MKNFNLKIVCFLLFTPCLSLVAHAQSQSDLSTINGGIDEAGSKKAHYIFNKKVKYLAKKVASIEFFGNTDIYINPAEAEKIIKEVADFIHEHPGVRVELTGVTSSGPLEMVVPLPVANGHYGHQDWGAGFVGVHRLAKGRANEVAQGLIRQGVAQSMISTRGTYPIFRHHWYSYLKTAAGIGIMLTPIRNLNPFWRYVFGGVIADGVKADRRVILRVSQ